MSGSVQALQAQIDKVSEDIERQSEALNNLKRTRSHLQRQLNAIRDPVALLPFEISSEIFLQCSSDYGVPGPEHIPMLLLNICHAWNNIVLSTPALWANISLILLPRRSEDFAELLKRWLERAGTHLLRIRVTGPLDPGIAGLIWSHSSHLGRLELTAEDIKDSEDESGDDDVIRQLLGGTQPDSLPFIQSLKITGREGLVYSQLQILQILHVSPHLSELILCDVQLIDEADEAAEKLLLPHLHRLLLNTEMLDQPPTHHSILECISAPHLKTLAWSGTPDDADHITSFLQRSTPPLHELIISDIHEFNRVDDLLALVPTVVHLEIHWPGPHFVDRLFTILAQTPFIIVPVLQSVQLQCMARHSPHFPWDTILRALSIRRTQMRRIHIKYLSDAGGHIPPNILAAFRELSAGGIDIIIGRDGDQNLLLS